ncbi:TMhelix containing protein [Vibrio phage 1.210.O._10N.222.52.C2]|nr:TMhelix containing protein [Vibrio phage 1.210.O._10N.222.52.C2]
MTFRELLAVLADVIVCALAMAAVFAMIAGKLPGQKITEPVQMCVEFTNGVQFSRANASIIKKYALNTGYEYKSVECK